MFLKFFEVGLWLRNVRLDFRTDLYLDQFYHFSIIERQGVFGI